MKIREHERVVLTEAIAASGLEAGAVGTVVHVHADGDACEVEFVALDGTAAAVVTLEADRIRSVRKNELAHSRARVSAGTCAW